MKKIVEETKSVIISYNKRNIHEYFIEKEFDAGLVLQGWEVKSLRFGSFNIRNSYVIIQSGEAFLLNASFIPIATIFAYYSCNSTRARKLLLTKRELSSLYGSINRDGYTIVVLSLFWKNTWCKIKIGIAKGKKKDDKRSVIKNREWQYQKARFLKTQSAVSMLKK